MTKIIVVIKGGMLQSVISDSDVQYVIMDFDNVEIGDPYPGPTDFYDSDFVTNNIDEHLLSMNPKNQPKQSFEEILKSDHPLLVLEREILQSYTLAPNEKVVLIENFEGNSFKTYAVYVNGEYDRKIHIRKY